MSLIKNKLVHGGIHDLSLKKTFFLMMLVSMWIKSRIKETKQKQHTGTTERLGSNDL